MVENISVSKNMVDQSVTLEQYKILVESLNKLNEMREASNNFWMGVNGVGISALAYLRDTLSISLPHKPFLLIILIMIGFLFCLSWLSYLSTIKNSIEIRSRLLADLERKFPNILFSKIFTSSKEESQGNTALTIKEMFVPCLFLVGYIFFAGILYFTPEKFAAPSMSNEVPLSTSF